MNTRLLAILLALSVGCLATSARAQRAPELRTVNLAVEAPARAVVLPSGQNSSLITAPCGGCAPKSFLATASTAYFVNEQRVSLAELKTAVAGDPQTFLTVLYSLKTGELISVTAAIVTPRATSR